LTTTNVSENKSENEIVSVIFNKVIDGNDLDDGDYEINVEHKLSMNQFYGYRSTSATNEFTFKYKTRDISVIEIMPYIKITPTEVEERIEPKLSLMVRVTGANNKPKESL
jgi:hypothetical protein